MYRIYKTKEATWKEDAAKKKEVLSVYNDFYSLHDYLYKVIDKPAVTLEILIDQINSDQGKIIKILEREGHFILIVELEGERLED